MRFLIAICICLFTTAIHVHADFLYPENSSKIIMSANKFYSSTNIQYSEFNDATLNIRKKFLYKNLEKVIKNEVKGDDNLFINLRNIYISKNPNISPNRQVYLFCSVKDTSKSLVYKYIIIDGETSKTLAEGSRKAN